LLRRALVIDARIKPHHAPPLEEDPAVSPGVDDIIIKDAVLRDVLLRTERPGMTN